MLVDLSRMIGTYLQDVFVNTLDWWVVLGLIAQFFFTARFVVQWLASERAGRSIIPVAFWFLSIAGGTMLLIYATPSQGPGLHCRTGLRSVCLSAQSADDPAGIRPGARTRHLTSRAM